MEQNSNSSEYRLTVSNASKVFKTIESNNAASIKPFITILNNINLVWKTGQIIGLVGLNGSGKTTMLSIMSGLQSLTDGYIYLETLNKRKYKNWKEFDEAKNDENIELEPLVDLSEDYNISNILRENISCVFSGDLINTELNLPETVENNLANFNLLRDNNRFIKYAKILNLDNRFFNYKAGTYSKGMKQKASLMASILKKAPFLILDEPFVGLDAPSCAQLKQTILELSKENIGIIVTSHTMSDLAELCDEIYSLNAGVLSNPIYTKFYKEECYSLNLFFSNNDNSHVLKQLQFFNITIDYLKKMLDINNEKEGNIMIFLENDYTICFSFFIYKKSSKFKKNCDIIHSEEFYKSIEEKFNMNYAGKANFFHLNAIAKILEYKIEL